MLYYEDDNIKIYNGDCLEVLKEIDIKADTVITDPPYGLEFMGKNWDRGIPGKVFWEVILQSSKPGAMLLAFGGTRTYHRLACAIEDAEWEIRDCLMWVYGQGFPKSYDISKGIDKKLGGKREVVGQASDFSRDGAKRNVANHNNTRKVTGFAGDMSHGWDRKITSPATDEAKLFDGYGTALKPAYEPIVLAMAPLDKNFVNNALEHGVSGLWIDGGRIEHNEPETYTKRNSDKFSGRYNNGEVGHFRQGDILGSPNKKGRFPANFIHDGSEEVVRLLEETARFFYCAKSSTNEKTHNGKVDNSHPTVKPLELLKYLCRLTKTPTGGIVLDPFMGSGTTLLAAIAEGRKAIGIELNEEYCKIAVERIKNFQEQLTLDI